MHDLSNIFKALSDKTRLRILKLLEEGELCVCDIVAALDMVQPKVSFHLSVLKKAGLIKDMKQGKWIHYRIDDSDIFRRFIIFSVLERTPEDDIQEDKKRLKQFLKSKTVRANLIDLKNKRSCCESGHKVKKTQHD
jgi:ArsR family transcriptional regulator